MPNWVNEQINLTASCLLHKKQHCKFQMTNSITEKLISQRRSQNDKSGVTY